MNFWLSSSNRTLKLSYLSCIYDTYAVQIKYQESNIKGSELDAHIDLKSDSTLSITLIVWNERCIIGLRDYGTEWTPPEKFPVV